MTVYKAPVRDINFVINELLDFNAHYQTIPSGAEATPDMIEAITAEAAKFAVSLLSIFHSSTAILPSHAVSTCNL